MIRKIYNYNYCAAMLDKNIGFPKLAAIYMTFMTITIPILTILFILKVILNG